MQIYTESLDTEKMMRIPENQLLDFVWTKNVFLWNWTRAWVFENVWKLRREYRVYTNK